MTLLRGENLPKMDSAAYKFGDFTKKALGKKKGYIDAFIIASYRNVGSDVLQTVRGPVVKKNYNPKWRYRFDCIVESRSTEAAITFQLWDEDSDAVKKGGAASFVFSSNTPKESPISIPLQLDSPYKPSGHAPSSSLTIVLHTFSVHMGIQDSPSMTNEAFSSLLHNSSSSTSSAPPASSVPPASSAPPTTPAPSPSAAPATHASRLSLGFMKDRSSENLLIFNSDRSITPAEAPFPFRDWAQAVQPAPEPAGVFSVTVLLKGDTKSLIGWAPASWPSTHQPGVNLWEKVGAFLGLYDGLAMGNPDFPKLKCTGPDPDPDWGMGEAEPDEVFTLSTKYDTNDGTISYSLNGSPFEVIFSNVSGELFPTFGFHSESSTAEITLNVH